MIWIGAAHRRGAVLVLCLLVLAELALVRFGIDDLDEGYFVQQGARVLQGQVPYRDFLTLYTPGLLYVHAALFWLLGGPYVLAPRVLALLARAALAVVLYLMARPLVRNPVWAAAPGVFLLLALDDAPERWEPHPGWLSTLFALVAAWCLSRGTAARWLVGAGLAAGVSYVFKQNTGVFILAAVVLQGALSARAAERPDRTWTMLVLVPVLAFLAFTAAWLVPLLVALDGQISLLRGFVGAVNQADLVSMPEWSMLVPLICLAGGIWLVVIKHPTDDPALVARVRWYLLAGAAIFCTQFPRMDTLHLAWSAPLLLLVGAVTMDRLRRCALSGLVVAGLLAVSWPTLSSRLNVLADHPTGAPIGQAAQFAAGLEVPSVTDDALQGVVADIQRRTRPGEPIFVYPTSPLLYVLAERPNPTLFDHLNPGAADAHQIQRVIATLDSADVQLVVVSDFWEAAWGPPGPNAALETWLYGRYAEVARHGTYRVLVPIMPAIARMFVTGSQGAVAGH